MGFDLHTSPPCSDILCQNSLTLDVVVCSRGAVGVCPAYLHASITSLTNLFDLITLLNVLNCCNISVRADCVVNR